MKRSGFPQLSKQLPPLANSVKRTPQVEQVQPPQAVHVQPEPQVVAPVQPAPSVQQGEIMVSEIPIVQTDTYISVGNKTEGIVEFDLMSHREKGQEVRYLHIQVRGLSLDDKGSPSNTYMAITNKEEFEQIKSFFSTLKWED